MHPASVKTVGKEVSDSGIARRIAAGDRDTFESLMRRYNQSLFRTARSILRDDAEAEHAVQEAYLLAYRAMGTYRGEPKLSIWLVGITVNQALARSRGRRAEIIQLYGERQSGANAAEADMNAATHEQPGHATLRAESRRLLEAKIDTLPDAFRTVFVLRALEELTVEEIAATLAIPEATVRARYFRAKGLLREALAREIDFAYDDAFAFAGARCDRVVAGVLARLTASQAREI
jgi:RNA polymerase sigma-70 factor (ECF subfamily)